MKIPITIFCLIFLTSVNGWVLNVTVDDTKSYAIIGSNDYYDREKMKISTGTEDLMPIGIRFIAPKSGIVIDRNGEIDWKEFCKRYGHCWEEIKSCISCIKFSYDVYIFSKSESIDYGQICRHCGKRRKKVVKEEWVEEK